tara:strand:+ start:247 stop:579 length:333 start_codon:yes stop_codon:yes gene_type:complete
MKPTSYLIMFLLICAVSACNQKQPYNLQGKAGDIGDAMEHCRAFMKDLLPDDAYVYIDSDSSRETPEHFDIFLDLQDKTQEGYGQCRVNKQGLIIYHVIREFRQKARSFS